MEINQTIFHAYDVRGKYPEEVNEESAYKIGRAFVTFLDKKKPKVSAGQDMRLSSPSLFKALVRGMTDQGADVVDVGLATTPMLYFSTVRFKLDGGVHVTGSHIPGNFNGFKFVREKAIPVSEESGLKEIKELALKNDFKNQKLGKIFRKKILNDYIKNAFRLADRKKINNLKVVVDAGNGMGGLVAEPLFKRLKCELIPLYFEPDGSFPHHVPNPLIAENTVELRRKIIEEKADLGIALDGDVDRVAFFDEQGEMISGDIITALLSNILLRDKKGQKIIYDVRSSWVVEEEVVKSGGVPLRFKVGHSLIKEKMRQDDVMFGGELTGHYYLRENNFIEAPLFVILEILGLVSSENKPLSEIVKPLKRYFTSGEINFEVNDKLGKLREIERHYTGFKLSYLDGLSIENKDWWLNIRPSNTENLLRLNIEAKNREIMEAKKKELTALIQR